MAGPMATADVGHLNPASLADMVLSHALARARDRGDDSDIAHGILAALAAVREGLSRQMGYAAMRNFDDTLRTQLMAAALERLRFSGQAPKPVAPPPRGPGADRAAAILQDAIGSCMLLNLYGPGNVIAQAAISRLLNELIRILGGLPDWSTLEAVLERGEGDELSPGVVAASTTRLQ